MHRLIVLLALVLCTSAGILQFDYEGRIVNGVDTQIELHPYQVSLQTNAGSHFCGGSIISEDIIVTAAHCLQKYKAEEFKVRLGATKYNAGGQIATVKAFKNHPGYDAKSKANDVGVIKLASPVARSASVRYIELATVSPTSGTAAVVTGWGTRCFLVCPFVPVTLQAVEVDIVSKEDCASNQFKYGDAIEKSMICAYASKRDACQGDSGGPLVADNKLVGIVSWGKYCAHASYPGVYADVAYLRDWILSTAASF